MQSGPHPAILGFAIPSAITSNTRHGIRRSPDCPFRARLQICPNGRTIMRASNSASTNGSRRMIRMENARRVVQVLAFAAFLYLFVMTVGKYDPALRRIALTSRAPIDTFFRMDPLLGLTTMVSVRQVIHVMLVYALPVVLLTVIAGRFFCGWICPLGTALDATDTLFFRKRRPRPPDTRQVRIKYCILIGVLAAAVFSVQLAYFFDPIVIITRALTFVVFPIVQLASRSLADQGVNLPLLADSAFLPRDVQYLFRLNFFASIVLVGILAANAVSRRYWCRNLCPLGALLAILSRFSIVRRVVESNCTKCARCVPDCKMGAIMEDPFDYHAPECVYCYACTDVCPVMSTKIVPTLGKQGYHAELDLNRRRVFGAIGVGALAAVLAKTNAAAKTDRTGKHKISSETLIRPPGALPEDEFVDRCVRCSECMKVCPTGGLQPAITEAGIEGLWTPVLVPRIGECTQMCNLCSQVCSSQAIQPFEIAEKTHLYIGRAVIDRSQCIAWNSDKQCLVCDEACSYDAVLWKNVEGTRRPFVNEHKCVGCGICENVCPIQPVAAIRVFSLGDQRHRSRADQKYFFEQAKDEDQNKPANAP